MANTSTELDLAFIIDATGSMGGYIKSAQDNMRTIIQDIIISEKCSLNVALILYRDHPPQDSSFVIKVNNFTDDAEEAKTNIDSATASGGGDGPEAMTPALHAAVHTLSWRKNAVKIAILIADAPPHGLDIQGDHWPNGDPSGHDPMECVGLLAEHGITLYTIGCEPAATGYRDFFMALAFQTGGQYIPLANCANLASVIIGSAREEISLEGLIAQVHEEVMREAASRGGPVDEAELTRRIHEVMHSGGTKVRRVKIDGTTDIPLITPVAEELSKLKTLKEVRETWALKRGIVLPAIMPTTTMFPAFTGLGKTKGRGRFTAKKKPVPATPIKKPLVKRAIIKKKKTRRVFTRGNRRSTRLALNLNTETDEDEDEEMETSTPAPTIPVVTKPSKLRTEVSNINLADDELLDVSQTRRLVRKCVARNKLKST